MSGVSESVEILPVTGPVCATIRPPGSKSITNRVLPIAAVAQGVTTLTGVLHSQDTAVMIESLRRLGVTVTGTDADNGLRVQGCDGRLPNQTADLWLENSGTSIRFLTGICAACGGAFRLDGIARMRERPIGDLIDALRQLGLQAEYELDEGFPPVRLTSTRLHGGITRISGRISSQFLSAVLLAAPLADSPVTIEIIDELVSVPYIEMTTAVMRMFGVEVISDDSRRFTIKPQSYQCREFVIEPDASAASYFFAAAAITGGDVTIPGLHRGSLQGDVQFVSILEQMGCEVIWADDSIRVRGGTLHGIDVDMNAISDTAQTLAAVAVFADSPTRIRNVEHMRHKETDRVSAVVNELRRAGIVVQEFPDGMLIEPGIPQAAAIRTYDDHRMAMSFALLGLRVPGITILDPKCTRKTYPEFFADLDRICGR